MRSPVSAILCVCLLLAGCGANAHGPAARVVSSTTDVRLVMAGGDQIDRQTVQESRLSDAEGCEWTESKVVKTERVFQSEIEAELFENALQAPSVRKP